MFDKGLAKEITDMREVFNQMETEVAKCYVDKMYFEIEKKDLFIENDHLLEHIIFQDVMCTAMHADFEHNCVLPANNNNLAYAELEKSYIAEYSKVLELKAELVKKKDMIEQDVFIELLKSYSKLEKHCISLEIAVQQSQESNLKNHIQELKGRSVAECTESMNKSKVIALGVYKLDLEPQFPKLMQNREVHVDYLKHTKEHADTLCEIVEQARALKPLDSALDSAFKDSCKSIFLNTLCSANKKRLGYSVSPMFDEYFNPPSSVVSRGLPAVTPQVSDTTGTPLSTSIGQDAPTASTSSTTHET
ncbi:hypothetical protein Tco_1382774 [Tanacetum coccineum]